MLIYPPIKIHYPLIIFSKTINQESINRFGSIVNLFKTFARWRKTSPSYHSALQLSSILRTTISSSKSLTVSQTSPRYPLGNKRKLGPRYIFFPPRAISRTFIPPPTYPVELTVIYTSAPPSFNILRRRRPDVWRGSRDRISDATFKSPESVCASSHGRFHEPDRGADTTRDVCNVPWGIARRSFSRSDFLGEFAFSISGTVAFRRNRDRETGPASLSLWFEIDYAS